MNCPTDPRDDHECGPLCVEHGDQRDTSVDMPRLLEKRFIAKIGERLKGKCWEWKGNRSGGYGHFWNGTREVPAHRFGYELWVGPIPAGLELDHLCRNRACVNPAHLEPVTHRVNTLRGTGFAARSAVATHCPKGHPYDLINTYVNARGGRDCRTCRTADTAKRWLRDRLLVGAPCIQCGQQSYKAGYRRGLCNACRIKERRANARVGITALDIAEMHGAEIRYS